MRQRVERVALEVELRAEVLAPVGIVALRVRGLALVEWVQWVRELRTQVRAGQARPLELVQGEVRELRTQV